MTASAGKPMTHEDQIRAIIFDWSDAVRAKDAARLVANLAPDARVFDLITPLQYVGAQTVRQRVEQWLSSFTGPLAYDVHQLRIAAGDDVAFCHSINSIKGQTKDGKAIDMAWRATVCFERISGQWYATHEHSSVPFDMTTGQASLDLKP